MGNVSRSFHNMLFMSEAIFRKKLYAALKGTGLTSGQPKILEYLSVHDGCVQKEIAAGCCIEPATVTSLLLRMEEAGLIRRGMEHGDRRSFYVHLTPLGKQRAELVNSVIADLEAELFQSFSEQEKTEASDLLSRVYDELEKMTMK